MEEDTDKDIILKELETTNLELINKIGIELNSDNPDYSRILLLKLKQYENISKYYSINMRFKEMQSIQKTCNEVVELLFKIDKGLLQFKASSTDDMRRLEDIFKNKDMDKEFILKRNENKEGIENEIMEKDEE